MANVNINAIVTSIVERQSGYKSAIKVLCNIAPTTPTFTAESTNISGATLSKLVDYGVLKVVDKTTAFIPMDWSEDTYRKVSVNVYAIDCDIFAVWNALADCEKAYKVDKIEKRIARLKEQLANALADLEDIK